MWRPVGLPESGRVIVRNLRMLAAVVGAAVTIFGASGAAAQFAITVHADETGVGTLDNTLGFHGVLPSGQLNDPGPGGLANALTYDMLSPPGLTAGDVEILDADGTLSDVLRFNPNEVGPGGGTGSFVFYSIDVATGNLADIGLPTQRYLNLVALVEGPVDGGMGLIYTPIAGQPGFVSGAGGPVTYRLVSDGPAVPEPASWALMIVGFGCVGAGLRAARRRDALSAA